MKRLLLFLAACGGNPPDTVDHYLGPPTDSTGVEGVCFEECGFCQVLTQTGCNTGEKCTWVLATDDGSDGTPGLGAISCAPIGTKEVGDACMFYAATMGGYDNCVPGAICVEGTCEQICDNNGGAPACATGRSCITHPSIFANVGATAIPAGVCEVSCDPLDDNDFDGSGTRFTKSGIACGSDPTVGCYGHPSVRYPTAFGCGRPHAGTDQLTHRAPVPESLVNVCMPGYEVATFYDDSGLLTFDCLAWCKPGDAYLGNPSPNLPNGVAPHRCNTDDALGAFGVPASDTMNGEHCMYSWRFEVDDAGSLHRSPTSDTLGLCVDHTHYMYDTDGNGIPDAPMPACATLPLAMAAKFGCVSTALAPPSAPRMYVQLPELR